MTGWPETVLRLSSSQRHYLLVKQSLGAGVMNFFINGLIAWTMFRGMDPIPMWQKGVALGPDSLATCALLPAITCLIVTPIVRRHVRAGKVESAELPGWLLPLRRPLAVRAFFFGVAGFVLAGLVLAGLMAAGLTEFAVTPLVWVKALYTGVLGAVVTPLIALLALTDHCRAH
ncbi:MAG: hypothetical protein ACR2RB_12400 [Gammaproteobacteria bacterium]